MCEKLLANPLVEDYEIIVDVTLSGALRMKFGVLQFPGSCDEVDALARRAAGGRRRAAVAWRARPQGRRRDRRARRVLLRRLPARRRDRALLAGDGVGDRLRRRRRAGARDLQRLSGAVRGASAARRAARQRQPALHLPPAALEVVNADTPFTRACAQRRAPEHPRQALVGALLRRRDTLRALEDAGQVVLRYAPRRELQRLAARHRGRVQRGRQRVRPDAPPRARRRRADRLDRRAEDLRVDAPGGRGRARA